MPRLTGLTVAGYRSIAGPVRLDAPPGSPVVIVGENNAGKSNLVRALSLVLGEAWPGTYEPEDHDFHQRNEPNTRLDDELRTDCTIPMNSSTVTATAPARSE